jgi:hypothetical protein
MFTATSVNLVIKEVLLGLALLLMVSLGIIVVILTDPSSKDDYF